VRLYNCGHHEPPLTGKINNALPSGLAQEKKRSELRGRDNPTLPGLPVPVVLRCLAPDGGDLVAINPRSFCNGLYSISTVSEYFCWNVRLSGESMCLTRVKVAFSEDEFCKRSHRFHG